LRTTYVTAAVIALLIGAWLLSGQLDRSRDQAASATLAQLREESSAREEDAPVTRVRGRVIHAELKTADVVVRGHTENKRTVQVKAETGGRVDERAVEKGDRVRAGDLLCRIALDQREAELIEAREGLNQARIDYDGSVRLKDRGLVSETMVASAKAKLASAEAALARIELDVTRTRVIAPFDGLVEDVHLEKGDFVQPGTPCATVIDLDPMLLVGRVAERDVVRLSVGAQAHGTLIDGTTVGGRVTFVGQQSDVATRTYPIEVEVANSDYRLRSGITTQIRIPVRTVPAHRISSALLALDDSGRVGVRTVDREGLVEFHNVEILAEDSGAVWVSGLPEVTTLITVGQELVVPKQRVDVDYEPAPALPASTPPPQGAAPEARARVRAPAPAATGAELADAATT
jgi:multidrug efflux system membrane fusion protein